MREEDAIRLARDEALEEAAKRLDYLYQWAEKNNGMLFPEHVRYEAFAIRAMKSHDRNQLPMTDDPHCWRLECVTDKNATIILGRYRTLEEASKAKDAHLARPAFRNWTLEVKHDNARFHE